MNGQAGNEENLGTVAKITSARLAGILCWWQFWISV